MERKGNKIAFNEDDQAKFNVAPEVDIASALQTTNSFLEVATGLNGRAQGLPSSVMNPEVAATRNKLTRRVAELTTFAANIGKLCLPEITQQMLQELETKQ